MMIFVPFELIEEGKEREGEKETEREREMNFDLMGQHLEGWRGSRTYFLNGRTVFKLFVSKNHARKKCLKQKCGAFSILKVLVFVSISIDFF